MSANENNSVCPTCGGPVTAGICPACALGLGADWKPAIDGFELIEEIGRGGMGVVWKARQIEHDRLVAVKLLRNSGGDELVPAFDESEEPPTLLNTQSDRSRQRFLREIKFAARMEHPHIARVYTSGVADDFFYYAMEYVDGVPLDEYVRVHKLEREAILELMTQICAAVQYAHDHLVLHRDLKPSNILVTPAGQAVVVDFGLARALDQGADAERIEVTKAGQTPGTPRFMSPEQIQGHLETLTNKSDVYSLGVILYTLLTGKHPHGEAESDLALLMRVVQSDAHPAHSVHPDVANDLSWLLSKALEREPVQRLASAGEFGYELQRFLEGKPLVSFGGASTYVFQKWLRRNRLGVSLGCAAVLAALLGVGAYVVSINAERTKTQAAKDLAVERADENQRLLNESLLKSVTLASQRGDWETCLTNLDILIEQGEGDVFGLELQRLQALEALGESEAYEEEVNALAKGDIPPQHRAVLLLRLAETQALKNSDEFGARVRVAIGLGLPPVEHHYAESLIAPSVPEARKHLEKVIELEPFHPKALGLLTIFELFSGEFDLAVAHIQAGKLLYPEDGQYSVLEAFERAFRQDLEGMKRALSEAEGRYDPESLETLHEILPVASKLIHSLPKFLRGERPDPSIIFNLMGLGRFKAKGGAASVLPNLVEHSLTSFVNALTGIVVSQDFEKSIEPLKRVVAINPDAFSYTILALCYTSIDKGEEAEEAAVQALKYPSLFPIKPFTLELAAAGAITQWMHGGFQDDDPRIDRAIDFLKQCLHASPDATVYPFLHVPFLVRREEWNLARQLVDRSIEIEPNKAAYHRYRAQVEFKAGSIQAAKQAAEAALALDPKDEESMVIQKECEKALR